MKYSNLGRCGLKVSRIALGCMSFGVEARYSWYGNQTFNGGVVASLPSPNGGFLFAPVTQTMKIETFEATARLNFKIF